MRERDIVGRFQDEFKRRFRLDGAGSTRRIQQQLGLGTDYFKSVWRKNRRSFDLKMMLDALSALKVEARDVFTTVLGPADPVAAFCAEAQRHRHESGRVAPILTHLATRTRASAKAAAGGRPEFDLEELDALRYENPAAVLKKVRQLILAVRDEDVPGLLGVYGSACRVAGRLEEAYQVLGEALQIASADDTGLQMNLIQRASYIAAGRGNFRQALQLAERATLGYAQVGDRLGLAKSLVEQGNWLFCLEELARSLEAYRAALKIFGDSQKAEIRRYRFSALLNSGIIHRKLGRLGTAEQCAAAAREHADGVGKVLLGNLLTFQAAVAKDNGKLDQAESFLRDSIAVHSETAPLDAAYSVIQLCGLELGRGRSLQAHQTAKHLLPLLDSLEDNPMATSCLTEILRHAVAGRGLTAEILGNVTRGLKKARERRSRAR